MATGGSVAPCARKVVCPRCTGGAATPRQTRDEPPILCPRDGQYVPVIHADEVNAEVKDLVGYKRVIHTEVVGLHERRKKSKPTTARMTTKVWTEEPAAVQSGRHSGLVWTIESRVVAVRKERVNLDASDLY